MIDFWINGQTYSIQMNYDKFGWTGVDESTGLSATPNSGYMPWDEFKVQFEKITGMQNEEKYLSLEVIWKDEDMFELKVAVNNGRFAGTTEVYDQRETPL